MIVFVLTRFLSDSCVSSTRRFPVAPLLPHTALTPFVSCGVNKISCFQHGEYFQLQRYVLFQYV